jgi:hypothetical protein
MMANCEKGNDGSVSSTLATGTDKRNNMRSKLTSALNVSQSASVRKLAIVDSFDLEVERSTEQQLVK